MTYSQSVDQKPTTNNEELVVMTKDRHEALRKDIEDYKLLLVKYQTLRIEQEILVSDLERQSNLLKNKNEILNEFRKRNDELIKEIDALNIKIEKQKMELGDLHKDYNSLSRNFYIEKGKVFKMKKGQAQVFLWKGAALFFFCGMLIIGVQN